MAKRYRKNPDLPLPSTLDVRPNLELNPWRDIPVGSYGQGTVERIGLLPNNTVAGRPSVAMIVRLADGTPVLAETTWVLLSAAVKALAASPVVELDRMEHPHG